MEVHRLTEVGPMAIYRSGKVRSLTSSVIPDQVTDEPIQRIVSILNTAQNCMDNSYSNNSFMFLCPHSFVRSLIFQLQIDFHNYFVSVS